MQLEELREFRTKKTTTPRNEDMSKHCRYHHNYGHHTEECVALKDKVEELIQTSHLGRFVQCPTQTSRRRERTPENRGGHENHNRAKRRKDQFGDGGLMMKSSVSPRTQHSKESSTQMRKDLQEEGQPRLPQRNI